MWSQDWKEKSTQYTKDVQLDGIEEGEEAGLTTSWYSKSYLPTTYLFLERMNNTKKFVTSLE